jgi:hypothetical protein
MTQPKRDIINAHQAAMLGILRDALDPICVTDLFTRTNFSRSQGIKQMTGLREADLVTETTPVCRKTKSPALWAITTAGRRAFSDYTRKQEQATTRAMAAAPQTNSFLGTTYTPPGQAYYRNDGNRHIPGVGVQC